MNTNRGFAYNPMISGFVSFVVGTTFAGVTTYMNGEHGWTDSRLPVLLAFLVTFAWPINVHAWQEAYRIEVKKEYINHTLRAFIRLLIFVAYGCFIHIFSERELTQLTWLRIFLSVFMMCSWFWFLFDPLLNLHRGKPFIYIGKASVIDKIFGFAGPGILWICKVVMLTLSITLYYNAIQLRYFFR